MKAELALRKPLERVTMKVELKVSPEFHARLWLGKALLVLAARVLGCQIEFKG